MYAWWSLGEKKRNNHSWDYTRGRVSFYFFVSCVSLEQSATGEKKNCCAVRGGCAVALYASSYGAGLSRTLSGFWSAPTSQRCKQNSCTTCGIERSSRKARSCRRDTIRMCICGAPGSGGAFILAFLWRGSTENRILSRENGGERRETREDARKGARETKWDASSPVFSLLSARL